MADIESPLL